MTAIAGLLTAFLLWWLIKSFARANPARVVQTVKLVGGAAALAATGLLVLRGRLDMAVLTGGIGAWLLGWAAPPNWWPAGIGQRRTGGGTSRVRSATLEMALDHETGAMSGRVLAGEFAGRDLAELGLPQLRRLLTAGLAGDVEGGRLLEAYLDRRFPGWREDAEGDPHRRGGADLQRGAMTEQEAYEILGLQPGAGPDDVRAAHRRLMKKLHPDQGGSTYLASRVNQAKDLLLDRHR
ncbi:DnaJ domain-containing protein [Enterovirga aerilata]|uniref:DnaJ domain-containing protein n=1 Tax=Enterovirga aerilata TaxID=2730920 RepID=A0A849I771_9HYPH|nr:DnaJ domain-containing protein [Enterovirga sp. DB1703]NNM71930.1 DnaJ domain-containing protein [Enterovirga sp. DB1703]